MSLIYVAGSSPKSILFKFVLVAQSASYNSFLQFTEYFYCLNFHFANASWMWAAAKASLEVTAPSLPMTFCINL